jgi:hypothetical protein
MIRTLVPRRPIVRSQAELAFDQTPDFDPTDAEPPPDFDFDQSTPDAWDE